MRRLLYSTYVIAQFFTLLAFSQIEATEKCKTKLLNSKTEYNIGDTLRIQAFIILDQTKTRSIKFTPVKHPRFQYITARKQIFEPTPNIRNGNLKFLTQYSQVFIFRILDAGLYDERLVACELNGKILKPNSTKIFVLSRRTSQSFVKQEITKPELKAEVSNYTPYIGEYVKVKLKLLLQPGNRYHFDFLSPPSSKDAYVESFYTFDNKNPKRKITENGLEVILEEFMLYPLKSGEISISPREIELSYSGKKERLQTSTIVLKVKDTKHLLNGNFTSSTKVNLNSAKVGDSIQLIYTISGSGNLISYTLPEKYLEEIKHNYSNLKFISLKENFEFTSKDLDQSQKQFVFSFKILGEGKLPHLQIPYFNIKQSKNTMLNFHAPSLKVEKQTVKIMPNIGKNLNYLFYVIVIISAFIILLVLLLILKLNNKKEVQPLQEKAPTTKNIQTSNKEYINLIKLFETAENEKIKRDLLTKIYNFTLELLSQLKGKFEDKNFINNQEIITKKIQAFRYSPDSELPSATQLNKDIDFILKILNKEN